MTTPTLSFNKDILPRMTHPSWLRPDPLLDEPTMTAFLCEMFAMYRASKDWAVIDGTVTAAWYTDASSFPATRKVFEIQGPHMIDRPKDGNPITWAMIIVQPLFQTNLLPALQKAIDLVE